MRPLSRKTLRDSFHINNVGRGTWGGTVPSPPPGWKVEEGRVVAPGKGASAHTKLAGPSVLSGIGPYEFRGRSVSSALLGQLEVRVGLVRPLSRKTLRDSFHINTCKYINNCHL